MLQLIDSNELPTELDAVRIKLKEQHDISLSPISSFNASELLEALFLEEPKPIVVFDAPNPEQIAIHLLTALWPNIRQRFALSTFALSPRKIEGRDLDVVFAPSNAKAKFSDWLGRRVDGRSSQIERHRWTKEIVRRVFEDPVPRLLSDKKIIMLGNLDTGNSAALRIALMWSELLSKLDQDPAAALGLLDIANSGRVSRAEAIKLLEPKLAEAIKNAGTNLPRNDAWSFVNSISHKMKGHDILSGKIALEQLATYLAEMATDGVLNFLNQPDPDGAIDSLFPSIATGLANAPITHVKQTLINMPSDTFARLVEKGGALAKRVSGDDELINKIGAVISEIDHLLAHKTGMALLPLLVEDRQLPAAIPIIRWLNSNEVVAEFCWLRDVNGFQAKQLCAELINRASEVDALQSVRDILIMSETVAKTDALLALTVKPVESDVTWLIDDDRLSKDTIAAILAGVLRSASDEQLAALLSNSEIGVRMISYLPDNADDILNRVAINNNLPIDSYVSIIKKILPKVDNDLKIDIAENAIKRCFHNRFDGDETVIISMLLDIFSERADGGVIAKEGLNHSIEAGVASRNLIIFDKANPVVRESIVVKIDVVARILLERGGMDLTEAANDACAKLMFDAEDLSRNSLMDAASMLIPSLMRARHKPVSLMLSVLFPIVYRELARSGSVPEPLHLFFLFLDWDRCKTARNEIVRAFMHSNWRPGDLALTACRCGDLVKILKQIAKSYNGEEYLIRIDNDLENFDLDTRRLVKRLIAELL